MGNSLGTILVQLVTEHIIETLITNLKRLKKIPPCLWIAYVDYHLVLCRAEIITLKLDSLNAFHPLIKFTSEIEQQNSINYLDLTIIRRDGRLITNWYTKPIASNRILNFYSNHPPKMIQNTAKAFVTKVLNYSDPVFHAENLSKVESILAKNNFPSIKIINLVLSPPTTRNRVQRQPICCYLHTRVI